MSDGFLRRWSRRKQEAREGRDASAEQTIPSAAGAPLPVPPAATSTPVSVAAQEPVPTLAEAEALTPASDFSRFVSRTVTPEVRNAAMKQLFRDPHFNVMDGLDTYIDDYTVADPISLAILRKVASAKFLGLVAADDMGDEAPKDPSALEVAQSHDHVLHHRQAAEPPVLPSATASPTPHAHTDLRLQPDHASPDGQSGDGAR